MKKLSLAIFVLSLSSLVNLANADSNSEVFVDSPTSTSYCPDFPICKGKL